VGIDVGERVQRDIGAQHLVQDALGLDREHRAAWPDGLGHRDRMRADIGAGLDDRVARREEAPQ
jgi:hypothetical protein